MKKTENWGGSREGSGRKKLPAGQRGKAVFFYLRKDEIEKVRNFIAELRKKNSRN